MEEEGEIAAFGENPSPTVGGFDFVFVSELSQEQKCPICLLAMRDPVQTKCGHRFCESCLLKSFGDGSESGSEPKCPRDRQPIPREGGWFNDKAWEREILSLCVKCKKSERGCEWTGEIRHYQKHFVICQYEDTTCDKCLETMYRGIFDIHTTSQCPNRIMQCEYCKEYLEFWQKEIHYGQICKSFPCPCPQECGIQEIPREELESHVCYDCMLTLVPCPYEKAGCSFFDKRNSLQAHLNASVEEHLIKTWSKLLLTTEQLNQSETELKYMKETLDEAEEDIRGLQVGKVCITERLADLELGNCDLHTNMKSVKNQLAELAKDQPEAIKAAKESMKTLLDQKVTDIISECRSSQKKIEEDNISLKKALAELQRKHDEAESSNVNEVSKLFRYVQAVHSEIQAVKGKQPLNPATRPPFQSNFRNFERVIAARSQFLTQREPGKENTDIPRDLIKRRQAALSSGDATAKKTRIEEASKCKTDCATRTPNGQPSRVTETRSTLGSVSEEDSGEDSGEDRSEDEC